MTTVDIALVALSIGVAALQFQINRLKKEIRGEK